MNLRVFVIVVAMSWLELIHLYIRSAMCECVWMCARACARV